MAQHNELGKWGEDIAQDFLRQNGYRILYRDWKYGHRDLDLVAIDNDVLVIVEVKTTENQVDINCGKHSCERNVLRWRYSFRHNNNCRSSGNKL